MRPHAYTATAKALHWLMAAIWLVAWLLGAAAVYMRDSWNPHHGLTITHKALASTLLFLIVVRIAWRSTHPTPALPDEMGLLMRRAAAFGHLMLYAVALLSLPVSGWFWSSVADKPIMVLGLFQLPPMTAPAPTFYTLAKQIYVVLAWTTGVLVLGHIAIALKHHFVDRDGVLTGMLPKRRQAQPASAAIASRRAL